MNEVVSLRCELCNSAMSCTTPAGRAVRYYHCAHCGRWVASSYRDELMRAHTASVESRAPEPRYDLGRIKERLTRWLEHLDERDPYFVLGLAPSASEEEVHVRFKELALQNHPDRGGDAAAMRRVIVAFEQIQSGKRLAEPQPAPKPAAVQLARRRRR